MKSADDRMLEEIKEKVSSLNARLVNIRRDIHSHPELSGMEHRTSRLVARLLRECGIDVREGVGGYGVVGVLKGAKQGGVVGIRADMDALPMDDIKDKPYASKVKGVMHACGHDVHTTVLLGVAMVLSSIKDRLRGTVKFIFQPSEESGPGGAKSMIEDGALEEPAPQIMLALHCYPELEVGKVGCKDGVMTASSDRFTITVKGRSGHASRPHQTVDAILVASMTISAIQHIVSRRTDPLHHAVISIGTINGGTAPNIIADRVEMKGTVRTLDKDVRQKIPHYIELILEGITTATDATYDFHYEFGSPSVMNNPRVTDLAREAIKEALGSTALVELEEPQMGSEDFAYFAERVPATFLRLGTANPRKGITSSLHTPDFDVDEDAIGVGVTALSWITIKYLLEGGKI